LALCWIKEEFQVAAALHYSAYIVSAFSLHMEAVYVLRWEEIWTDYYF
jgi:hypothetical protein